MVFGLIKIIKPKLKLENEDIILNAINGALKKYEYLPSEFNENERHAEAAMRFYQRPNLRKSILINLSYKDVFACCLKIEVYRKSIE